MAETNTLAYFIAVLVTRKKSFTTCTPGLEVAGAAFQVPEAAVEDQVSILKKLSPSFLI
jgi:hypothetical protein